MEGGFLKGKEGILNAALGGSDYAWEVLKPLVASIHFGPSGSGRLLKRWIEAQQFIHYELCQEMKSLLEDLYHLGQEEIQDIFESWNTTYSSYLALTIPDSYKQSAEWIAAESLRLNVPMPSLMGALSSSHVMNDHPLRAQLGRLYPQANEKPELFVSHFLRHMEGAFLATHLVQWEQALALLRAEDEDKSYGLDFKAALQFVSKTVLSTTQLTTIETLFEDGNVKNVFLYPELQSELNQHLTSWKMLVQMATAYSVPCAGFSSALAYFEQYRRTHRASLFTSQESFSTVNNVFGA